MNKYLKVGFVSAFAAIALQSCYDEKMEWYNPYTPISKSEIPQETEKLVAQCQPLKSYAANASSDFHLGVSVLGSSYVENTKYAETVNDNFNSIQPSTEFALCNVVTDINGTYNYDMPDALYNAAIDNGLSIFGHCLISNQFQNVEFLQNAIADKVSPSEETNYINVSGNENEYDFSYSFNLEDYQLYGKDREHYNDGWSFSSNVSDSYFNVGVQSLEITDGDDCVKSENKACLWASTEGWEQGDATDVAQVVSDYVPVPNTGKLSFSFYVKGYSLTGQTAKMRVRILGVKNGLNGLVPASGGTSAYTSEIRLTNDWKQITFRDLLPDGTVSDYSSPVPAVRIVFDITEAPNSYVYFDNLVLKVSGGTSADGPNYIANSYFDGNEKTYNWSFVENRESVARMELGKSINGNDNSISGGNCLKIVNTASYNSAGDVTVNAMFTDNKTLVMGQRYRLTFYARADVNNAIVEFSTSNKSADKSPASAQSPAEGQQSYVLSTIWEKQVWDFTALSSDIGSMNFKFAKTATTFYLDDVTLTPLDEPSSAKSTRLPNYVSSYDDAMKAAKLSGIMKTHIENMMNRYDKVDGWDVVQHIVSDNQTSTSSTYLDSKGLSVGNGEFYWGDYMKEDFIFNAFTYARNVLKANNSKAKLFVSEGNLVHNEKKFDRLNQFINRLQAYEGQKLIDGLSLELHLVCSTEIHTQAELLNQVTELFKELNSTYCTGTGSEDPFLIRIGELDVQIESDYLPSVAQLAAQAEMYEHVINCYRTIINQRNQYGVYMWMLTDSDVEQGGKAYNRHRSLFDEDYQRKHAYLGVCRGFDELAGTSAY
ncbi:MULTISPECIES: endo-1,4-beta-xylanase [unclassified Bacteroides]|uniref:endo-1,4-beta-xylanase n=1 Tax=unclassified Bacteroides TaxID=2646097 RepID=UPI0009DEBB86|nr:MULTISPECIES: endo-1,4-beta-xylanase [unclassified Bacteroides]